MLGRTFLQTLALATLATVPPIAYAAGEPEGLRIGVTAGVAIPDEHLGDVYDLATSGDDLVKTYDVAASLGLSIGARLRMGLSENVSLTAGIDYNRFQGQDLTARLENGTVLVLSTATNIVPIRAGLHMFLVRSVVSPYVVGDLSYTYRNVTLQETSDPAFTDLLAREGKEVEPKTWRFGASAGAGVELRLGVLNPFLEVRYNATNLIGRLETEQTRTFVNVCAGLTF